MNRWFAIAALAALLLAGGTQFLQSAALAKESDTDFRRWLVDLWPEAQAMGVSRQTFDAAFDGIKPDRSLPDLDLPGRITKRKNKGQPEFVKPPSAYLRERTLVSLTKRGREHAAKWREVLAKIEGRFGVNGTVILAIWGRETVFGRHRLKHNAIRAIATQAFLGRRKAFFRKELLHALLIVEEGHITLANMRSSWAGAMGHTQFLPTNFYDHAVDFDGDGRRDIWKSIPDSLASTAKSLVDNGWVRGRTWGYEVRKPKGFDCGLEGIVNSRSIRQWLALGFVRSFDRKFRSDRLDDEAYLLLPEGVYGPAFLMLKNFLVIKSYNFADLYALFVGNLSDRIAGGGRFETPWATSSQISKQDVAKLQGLLNQLGYKAGKVDGRAGQITRLAIAAFQKATATKLDCYPSRRVLKDLRRLAAQ